MDLYEYQGKEVFRRFGIPVSEGRLATTPEEARAAAEELGGTVVVKAQVLTGGRGKAGGVKVASGPDEAEEHGARDPRARHPRARRARASGSSARPRSRRSTTSRSRSTAVRARPLLMFTTRGGVDIEQVAAETPEALARVHVDPLEGYRPWHGRRLIYGAGIADAEEQRQIAAIVERLYRCFAESDAMLCEINPLIVTAGGEVVALDAKVTIDESALFRQPDLEGLRDTSAADPLEAFAREKGVTYVKLDGSVGILGNGAGLSMSTVDVVVVAGGRPANFCDLGGGGSAQGVVDALEVIARDDAGALDPVQHLRRHHALRRGRARDPRGARAGAARGADRRAPRRHERRGGPARPRRGGRRRHPRRADDARRARRAVELAA